MTDSLFSRQHTKTRLFDSNRIEFTQIPLQIDTLFACISKNKYQLSNQNTFPIKSYYIKRVNKVKNTTSEFITTLIPTHHDNLSADFLFKPGFSGIVLYSRLNGEFFKLENYKKGKITKGRIYTPGEIEERLPSVEYVLLFSPKFKMHTKGGDQKQCPFCGMEYDLPAIIVVPKDEEEPPPLFPEYSEPEEENSHTCDGGGGGGGGSFGDSGEGTESIKEEVNGPQYVVTLFSNDSSRGYTDGSGTYEAESDVSIGAIPLWGHQFIYWNGNVPLPTQIGMSFPIMQDVCATAYFDLLPQCKNFYGNKANPLGIMELQPANGWNIPGATFGATRKYRNGSPKQHDGVDLGGPEGAPIYAMFEGVIGPKYIIGQPDKINGEYPSGYTGDRNEAGNRIYIRSQIDGNDVNIGYCHLMVGEPVAVNPRTGQIFAPGDAVFQGDVIGYIGATGNANPKYPHLHLAIYENGAKINPVKYLNAIIQTSTKIISTPCD